jgi:subtilisin family serine protease
VSATNNTDTKASWANYGTCVDIFGPGVGITSSWYTSNSATNTISGTSMATPHVVGAAALYLESNPGATPAQVASALIDNATLNVVKSGGSGSPNRLLYTGASGGGGGGSSGTPPVASFTYGCSGRSCAFDASATTNASSYAWNFGDGTTGSGVTASHNFPPNGTFNVTLTATGGGGSNATSKSVTCVRKVCS